MKKFFAAMLVAVALSGVSGVLACGGMTQIDPPMLQMEDGPSDQPLESIMSQIESVLVIC